MTGHVAFVASVRPMGGSSRSLLSLLEHLPAGLERTMIGPGRGAMHREITERGLVDREIVLDRNGIGVVLRAVAAARGLRHHRPVDAIHANGTADLLLALPSALAARAPVVVWVHDEAVKRWARRLRRLISALPIEIRWVAVSPSSIAMLVDAGLATADDIELIPNPIDPVSVAAQPAESATGRRIAFLGNATDRKGFDLLPRILEQLSDLDVRLAIHCRPSDDDAPAIAAAWADLEAHGQNVEVVGRVPMPRDALSGADVVLVPSRSESFGRVVAEAQLNGIPVVASDLAPFRWLIDDGVDGVLFPVDSPLAAADGIRRALSDEMRRSAATSGPRSASRFRPESVAEQMVALYRLRRDGRPAVTGTSPHTSSPSAPTRRR